MLHYREIPAEETARIAGIGDRTPLGAGSQAHNHNTEVPDMVPTTSQPGCATVDGAESRPSEPMRHEIVRHDEVDSSLVIDLLRVPRSKASANARARLQCDREDVPRKNCLARTASKE